MSLLAGMCWGSANLLLYDLFPASIRYTGVAVSDSIGRIIFSAPIPFLCNYLNNNLGFNAALVPNIFIAIILIIQLIKKID